MSLTTNSSDGSPIAYSDTGTGSPALLFVHGWCCHRGHWDQQIAHFSSNHRCVALDLAGHGQSGGADRSSWSIGAFAADVIAVADACELDDLVLIGHSMGGSVIVEAARHLKGRFKALVGADTFKFLSLIRTEEQIATELDPWDTDWPLGAKEKIQGMFADGADPNVTGRILNEMIATGPEVGIPAFRALRSNERNLQAGISELAEPIWTINAKSQPMDPAAARSLGVHVKLMDGVGHFVMLEDAETFNNILGQIIDEL